MTVIAHLSDLHLGAHVPEAVDALVADVTAAAPTLTVVTGDCTQRARAGQFRQARALLERLPGPLLVVPGNHDVPLGPVRRLLAPYGRYRRWIDGELDPVVRLPGVWAVGLGSTPRWRWKDGRVSRRQVGLVADALAAAPPGVARLVALHHPLCGNGRLLGRSALARALAGARVDLLLAGHEHVPSIRCLYLAASARRVVQVVAGTATSWRTRGTDRSWTLIRVGSGGIVAQERRHAGAGWAPRRTTWHRRPG